MRLFNKTLAVLAAVLLASGTALSEDVQTSVSNVDTVHSSHVLAGESESKRLLRSHPAANDEDDLAEDDEELTEDDDEERKYGANLFSTSKMDKMIGDELYRYQVARRWNRDGFGIVKALPDNVPPSLVKYYLGFMKRHNNKFYSP